MIKSKKQMYMVIGIFALVLFLGGTTYAFFNYTRTGVSNTIRTGRISFNTSQSNTLNITNVFPMSSTDALNANLDAVSVRIWGDTTYADGEEYEISIVDVNNTIGSGQSAKTIPINYIASYTATPVQEGDPNVIGTNSDNYFTSRGSTTAVYQLSTTGEATNGEQVLIGYIPSGGAGIDGTLAIKAYLDSSKIAISDTYDESDPGTDNMGTTSEWVGDRVVLTITEWNALQNTQTPLSFKIKAVSQEGVWVPEPSAPASLGTITSCPGCKFMYKEYTGEYSYGANGSTLADIESNGDELVDDYTTLNNNYFLGFKIENGVIAKAYACGIKSDDLNHGTPFCLEAVEGNQLAMTNNGNLITGSTLWNDSDGAAGRCTIDDEIIYCNESSANKIIAETNMNHRWVYVGSLVNFKWCYVGANYDSSGYFAYCGDLG